MDSFEANTHVFIVRVWLEPQGNERAAPEWRAVIEHAPTRRRRYLNDLNVIPEFIKPYLRQMGVKFGFRQRIQGQLKRRAKPSSSDS